ncbi:NAD(P)-binding protein [Panus rudis PR-1116 ss-1]|nr:NAD(P)-binding protein [Panus rudis PR-1116 ss-1]
MSETYTWFITGCSRGLGLELARQLATSKSPFNFVVATCRNPDTATKLKAITPTEGNSLHIIPLDVSNEKQIWQAAKEAEQVLDGRALDYLVNNAGIYEADDIFNFSPEGWMKTFTSNVLGPALITRALLHLVEKSKRKVIVNVSSGVGSIALDYGAKYASYSPTKTALNMVTYKQSVTRPDLIFLTMCPGHVRTDMGGEHGEIDAWESMSGLIKVATNATHEHSGRFWRYNGLELPW